MSTKKRILSIIFIILVFVLVLLTYIVYGNFFRNLEFTNRMLAIKEKNSKQIFSINQIVFFSSCNANITVNSNSTTNINDLYQFTDIAIFLNNDETNLTLENTLKSLSIENIKFVNTPSIGSPNLYYKSIDNFTRNVYLEENLIKDSINFNITSEDVADFSTPVLFNNCANPIFLCYVNSNIKDSYTLSQIDNSITYDGTLLKKCNIFLDALSCSISFDIFIENNLGQKFKCPVYLEIPLKDDHSSIYNGCYVFKQSTNLIFYRYE